MRFRDRTDAGQQLATLVASYRLHDPIVLGLPRGGLPVAAEVATVLGAPLDVFVARKVGAPGHAELGMGAIAEDGGEVLDPATLRLLGVSIDDFRRRAEVEQEELDRRVSRYRDGRALPNLADHDVVLVDDGLATGVTAEAAIHGLRTHRPRRIILAAPVCSPTTATRLRSVADEVVCVEVPDHFSAVGQWYERFEQTSDDEVLAVLAARERPSGGDARPFVRG